MDFAGDFREFGVDGVELARRAVSVEMAVEGDFVADAADFAVLVVALGFIDPRQRHMRRHLAGEVFADVLAERDVLVVAQIGVRFGVALGILADFRVVVMLAEVLLEELGGGGGEREVGGLEDGLDRLEERGTGEVGLLKKIKSFQENSLLIGVELLPCFVRRESGTLFRVLRLETELQRTLDGDAPVAEGGGGEELRAQRNVASRGFVRGGGGKEPGDADDVRRDPGRGVRTLLVS